ncbi:MAG: DUF4271 domain-containing protein [Tannerellaceae bacterium]
MNGADAIVGGINSLFEGYVGIRLWDGQQIDDIIFMLLLFMLMAFAVVFQLNFNFFVKMLKDVAFLKERHNLFEVQVGRGVFFRNFMTVQALFLCSLCLFSVARSDGYLMHLKEGGMLMVIILLFCVLFAFYIGKRVLYLLLASVFAEPERYKFWKTNYNAVTGAWGVLLYVPTLWLFFIGSHRIVPIALFGLFFFLYRFVLIYKTIRIFHGKSMGLLYISLYLCGQEILPLVFLYEGMVYLYNFIETSTLWH